MRLRRRLNREVMDRACLLAPAWQGFFGAGRPVGDIPHAGRHRPEQRQRHDQDEAVEPSGKPDLAVFEPEAAALEIGEHGLDAPAQANNEPSLGSQQM